MRPFSNFLEGNLRKLKITSSPNVRSTPPLSGKISCPILDRVLGLSLDPCLQSKSKSLNKAKTRLKQG